MFSGAPEQIKIDGDFYTHLPIGCLTVTAAGGICRANPAAVRLLAAPGEDLMQCSILQFLDLDHRERYQQIIDICLRTGEVVDSHLRFRQGRGTFCWVRLRCMAAASDGGSKLFHLLFDLDGGQTTLEQERELMAELMVQLNSAPDLDAVLSQLSRSLQQWAGCEAVGIRLRCGDDYPYRESCGFPSEHILRESALCSCDETGRIVREPGGNVHLECMCGNILQGRYDPIKPHFTEKGSLWCNDLPGLLDGLRQENRQGTFRKGCCEMGHHSMVLVPLRANSETLGLLQFNDRRPSWFNRRHVAHFERIAAVLSLALARRQAEEALVESEGRFRAFAHFTYAMETWQRPDGSFGYVSPACERVTGYPSQSFLENPRFIAEITHPDDRATLENYLRMTLEDRIGDNTGLEFRIVTASGETRWLSQSCTAIYDTDGQWLGRRGSYRDITKIMLARQNRERFERRLRQIGKEESLERMAGAIAHHFNNKLHVIQLYLQLAQEVLPANSPSHYNICAALTATEKASEISRLMHTYLGYAEERLEPLDLASLCREHLGRLVASLPGWITLHLDLPASGPIIDTSSEQVFQILTRLITNASEAIREKDGSIEVWAGVVDGGEIPAMHRFPGDWSPEHASYGFLSVRDTGCGLSEQEVEKIFDPFYSSKSAGRGLGLPVVLGLAQAQHGVVSVRSGVGDGSTFSVFLPLSVAP
ncbi:MAG: PAS domain-containing protein [Desulfopila sp.]